MKAHRRSVTLLLVVGLFGWTLTLCGAEAKATAEDSTKAAAKDSSGAVGSSVDTGTGSDGTSTYWMVEFEPLHLRMIAPREGIGAGRVYWYMVYKLSNPGKEDRDILLSITAQSDGKKEYADLYLPSVEKAIEKKEREPLWGKTDEFEIVSKRDPKDPKYQYITLKAGETRKSVAVFNSIDPNASKIVFRIAGLSNEIKSIAKEDGGKELEERIRELRYERPGDEYGITADSFKLVGKEWVKKRVPLTAPKPASK